MHQKKFPRFARKMTRLLRSLGPSTHICLTNANLLPTPLYSQVTEKYGLQLPNGLQKQPFADSCLNHSTRPTEKTAVFQPSSGSDLLKAALEPLTDEYVIITKSDPRDRSEPQNIPRMGLVSRPVKPRRGGVRIRDDASSAAGQYPKKEESESQSWN